MKRLYWHVSAPALERGVERALDALGHEIAIGWSPYVMDNSGHYPRPMRRNWDGEQIPVEGRAPFYTIYARDRMTGGWTSFLEIERIDHRLPKALERDLWLNRNRGSDRARKEREEREALQRHRSASRQDDQHHWILENKSFWKDALHEERGAHQTSRGAKIFSGVRHSYRGTPGEVRKTRREQGLTPHPRGRDEY